MGNPADIKEMIQEVGVSYTVTEGTGSAGYLRHQLNRQVTKPFIQEFFIEALFPYDADVVIGAVIEVGIFSNKYLLTNKNPLAQENQVTGYESVLYKCNVSGELQRPSGEIRNPQTYQVQPAWQTVKEVCYGLQTESLYGHDLESDIELGSVGLERHELYVPSSVGIQILDRYVSSSGEFYRVETIKKRRYSGVDVAELGEDTR